MPRILGIVVASLLTQAPALALAWPSPHTLGGYAYVSPAPGSALHHPETNVIVRPGGTVDPATLASSTIQASGSVSGAHPGFLRLSDDG
ncbi:MAG TPA: hypothetical protein VFM00_13435, partial [Candidatus Eisenbacteria bacterium]|nr:hypothetical protein [Candidatus Eisenbacteria bacterium]